MKKEILLILLMVGLFQLARAQYPKISADVQRKSDSIKNAGYAVARQKFTEAIDVIKEEAAKGRPYIPYAHRPTDLPQADIPAFPGAMGGGMYSFGGRGGRVIVVTSLEDSGPGTLRDACEQAGARIVVFNVSGIIKLKTPLLVIAPYITIAGQTAPGDGICVAGESFLIDAHDVIIRHMRFRRGETWVGRRDDAIGGNPIGNIMLDHISASWGLDENMSVYRHNYNDGTNKRTYKYPTVNITIQNSIFSEALDTWNHSFGSTLGGENCTFIRNLWACNAGRNPSIGWNGIFNFANNVIFNWYHRTTDGGDHTAQYNIINNYYKPGPVTPLDKPIAYRILKPESRRRNPATNEFGRCYVEGNIVEGFEEVSKDNWKGGVQPAGVSDIDSYIPFMKLNKPAPMPWFQIMTANESYSYVLENAGAVLPCRDAVDIRIIKTVKTGQAQWDPDYVPDTLPQFKHRRLPKDSYKKGIITNIAQVGGYPEYKGTPGKDADMDGMPDEWENKYGLNPDDASDANGDINGDGYTNIEKYINGIDPAKKVNWKDLNNNKDTLAEKGGVLK